MKATARDLKGRKITAVDWNKFDPSYRDDIRDFIATDPVLTLDNGRRIWFEVQETGIGRYGVEIMISERAR